MRFATFENGDIELNYAACGSVEHPLVICLHGFPEYWAAWSAVMWELCDSYHIVAPDQRGFNLSFRPQGVEAYRARHMVQDLADLGRSSVARSGRSSWPATTGAPRSPMPMPSRTLIG